MFNLLLLLFTKHFIVDFILQPAYMYLNKGNLLHPGGYYHAWLHSTSTWMCFIILGIDCNLFADLLFLEFIIHYTIDYMKVNINKTFMLKPDNSEKYWWLLGFDQYLHSLTYLWIALSIFK